MRPDVLIEGICAGDRWAVPWGKRATTHILKVDRPTFRHEALEDQDKLDRLGLVADLLDRAMRCEALAATAQQPTRPRSRGSGN